ncbi:hypothetical protein QNO09_12905 [Streptomyces sp. 378]|uniref:hypothetical protein n=1 Tax=Streptomyces sp. 378 TaxID=3049412 RepID=UPI0024C3C762|nr:hypothetical protein [Streptomyces sp. 378]MDK1344186.1 hypothetical protein [Streptomyces sp. 378]
MRIRTTIVVATAALAITLVGCSSDNNDSEPKTTESSSQPSTDNSAAEKAAGIPAEPTGAKRDALLAAIHDVNAKLTADEDKAIDAARNQCSGLNGGAKNPDHLAAERFSYNGITLTDDDGAHLNIGLRKTLCPKT